MNTYKNYNQRNNAILDNSNQIEDINMFMNSCSQQPLYNGGIEKVKPYYMNLYNSAPVMKQVLTQKNEVVDQESELLGRNGRGQLESFGMHVKGNISQKPKYGQRMVEGRPKY